MLTPYHWFKNKWKASYKILKVENLTKFLNEKSEMELCKEFILTRTTKTNNTVRITRQHYLGSELSFKSNNLSNPSAN